MLDLTQTIEQAEKLGFGFISDESVNYFEFPNERISIPFASFIHSLAGFKVLTSLAKENLAEGKKNLKSAHDNAREGAQLASKNKDAVGKPLSADDAEIIKLYVGNFLGSIDKAQEVYLSMYVITLVSKFEAYIQNIISEVSRYYPATMKSGKMISVNEILQFKKMSLLVEYLAENASAKSTEGTATEYLCRLGSKYGIPICQFKELISEVEYFIDIRHIQVHKNGVIDSQFHQKYSHAGNLGESINIDFDLLAHMSYVFRLTANLIEVMLAVKFPKIKQVQSENEVDNFFIELERVCEGEKQRFQDQY